MIVKKLSEAKEYVAPNHRACSTLRLFGAEAGGSKALIVGVSHFLPGGGAGPDASPPEKVYYVLAGELTVIVDGKETVLKQERQLLHRPEREPRDRQPRQRGLHHLRRGRRAAGVMTTTRADTPPSCPGLTRASSPLAKTMDCRVKPGNDS